ncbi:MAG: hypothetical protein WDO13_17085 [Verrucomicrobiota bacterium]
MGDARDIGPVKAIALWLGALALAVLVLMALCPRIITGRYADITIDRISVDKNGQYLVECSALATAGTTVTEAFYDDARYRGGGGSSNNGFLGWPLHGTMTVSFTLDPEAITTHEAPVPRPDRLRVHEGQNIHLRSGERLYFYDFTTTDGVRHDGYLEVGPYTAAALRRTIVLPPLR